MSRSTFYFGDLLAAMPKNPKDPKGAALYLSYLKLLVLPNMRAPLTEPEICDHHGTTSSECDELSQSQVIWIQEAHAIEQVAETWMGRQCSFSSAIWTANNPEGGGVHSTNGSRKDALF